MSSRTNTVAIPAPDQMLAELAKLASESRIRPEGFHSTAELAEMYGASPRTIIGLLKDAAKSGRLEQGKVPITDLGGRQTTVVAYRIKSAKK